MDICEKLRWMADKSCNELIEAAEEIERLREELKSYSSAVENLDAEVAAQRRAANEHRNAAMEADLRTQAAVRSEKKALAENATLKLACETNNRLLDERTEQLNKLDATAAHWLQKAHEYQNLSISLVMPHFREAQKLAMYLDAVQNKAMAEGKKLAHDKIRDALKEIL